MRVSSYHIVNKTIMQVFSAKFDFHKISAYNVIIMFFIIDIRGGNL